MANVKKQYLKDGWVRKTTTYPSGVQKISEKKSVPFGFDKIRLLETRKVDKKR